MSKAIKKVLSRLKKHVSLISILAAILGVGVTSAVLYNPITPEKLSACYQDKFVRMVGNVDIASSMGSSVESLREELRGISDKLTPETYALAQKSLIYFEKHNKGQFPAATYAFSDCLNKR